MCSPSLYLSLSFSTAISYIVFIGTVHERNQEEDRNLQRTVLLVPASWIQPFTTSIRMQSQACESTPMLYG